MATGAVWCAMAHRCISEKFYVGMHVIQLTEILHGRWAALDGRYAGGLRNAPSEATACVLAAFGILLPSIRVARVTTGWLWRCGRTTAAA